MNQQSLRYTLPETSSSHLKIHAWKMNEDEISFWNGLFSRLLLLACGRESNIDINCWVVSDLLLKKESWNKLHYSTNIQPQKSMDGHKSMDHNKSSKTIWNDSSPMYIDIKIWQKLNNPHTNIKKKCDTVTIFLQISKRPQNSNTSNRSVCFCRFS